jgi:hypothetical protein
MILRQQPADIVKVNSKRVAKGKSELTEEQYLRSYKNSKIIATVIIAASWVISFIIMNF